jgi:hypothetical protein
MHHIFLRALAHSTYTIIDTYTKQNPRKTDTFIIKTPHVQKNTQISEFISAIYSSPIVLGLSLSADTHIILFPPSTPTPSLQT